MWKLPTRANCEAVLWLSLRWSCLPSTVVMDLRLRNTDADNAALTGELTSRELRGILGF